MDIRWKFEGDCQLFEFNSVIEDLVKRSVWVLENGGKKKPRLCQRTCI